MYLLNIKGFDILAYSENDYWGCYFDGWKFEAPDIVILIRLIEGFMKLNKQKYFNF
jgi:hypothetical protein